MTPLDLKPAIDLAFTFVDSMIVTVLVPAVGWFVMKKLHIDATNAIGQRVLTGLSNGAAYALSQAQGEIDARSVIDIQSPLVATGAKYVVSGLAPELNILNITPDRLDAMVAAQIQKQLGPPIPAVPAVAALVPLAPPSL